MSKGSRKKKIFSGRDIKRGGGKGPVIKEKILNFRLILLP